MRTTVAGALLSALGGATFCSTWRILTVCLAHVPQAQVLTESTMMVITSRATCGGLFAGCSPATGVLGELVFPEAPSISPVMVCGSPRFSWEHARQPKRRERCTSRLLRFSGRQVFCRCGLSDKHRYG